MRKFSLLVLLCPVLLFIVSCDDDDATPIPESIQYETTLTQIDSLDKAGRWLAEGVREANESSNLTDEEESTVTNYLHDLATQAELRCQEDANNAFLDSLRAEGYTAEAITIIERAYERVCSLLNYHEGYWVATIDAPGVPVPVIAINDMHVDAATKRITVYAQTIVNEQIQNPAQVGPGSFVVVNGDSIGYHPNAVYLNGSGQEFLEDVGNGSWWVKHSWELDGEGYYNWGLALLEYDYGEGLWATATMLEDDITMKIGDLDESDGGNFNLRFPILTNEPITYQVDSYSSSGASTPTFTSAYVCTEDRSAFDGLGRSCPVLR